MANFPPEQVANFSPESVANFDRNRWPTCPGIRNLISDRSVGNILKANGIDRAPDRKRQSTASIRLSMEFRQGTGTSQNISSGTSFLYRGPTPFQTWS